jgi:mRNA export factor
MAKVCDLTSLQTVQVAAHDNTVKSARFFELPNSNSPMLVTGSWDKTVKYWDLRSSNPVGSVTCQERVYSMDVRNSLLVIGTADRYINVVNLQDPMKFYKTLQSPLKWQTRVVSCFTDASGFAIGSIEGRCAIQYVEDKDSR